MNVEKTHRTLRKVVLENQLVKIIFIIHLSYVFNESTISINDCLSMGLEGLIYSNQIIFIHFVHSTGYDRLERL